MMQTDVTRQSFSATIVQFILLAALFWVSAGSGGDPRAAVPPGPAVRG
ncbi:MAG: hypothetical protein LUE10_07990 [Alistipes sp.]|nr:hypothetical protein [Alistipes sp.]